MRAAFGSRRLFALAACVTVSAAAAAAAQASAPPAAVRQPLSALPIVTRIKVPIGPGWLGTGFGSVWLSKSDSRLVLRIDPDTNQVVATIPVGTDAELGIGIGSGAVWIADPHDRTLTQIDPATNRVAHVYPVNLPAEPEGSIGVGPDSLWVLTNENGTDSGTLSRIDSATGRTVANIRVPPRSHAAVVAFDSVWVTSSADSSVTRVDPRTNAVTAVIRVHGEPRFCASGMGSLWVVSQRDGTLARIDPRTNSVTATIPVGVPGPGGDISVGEGYVWVSAEGVPLSQIDPATNKLVSQFVGGKLDDTLRVGFGSAWIVSEATGEIGRVDLKELLKKQGTLP